MVYLRFVEGVEGGFCRRKLLQEQNPSLEFSVALLIQALMF